MKRSKVSDDDDELDVKLFNICANGSLADLLEVIEPKGLQKTPLMIVCTFSFWSKETK